VAKIMQAKAAGRRDECRFQQLLKRGVNLQISQRPAVISAEHALSTGTLSAAHQVAVEGCRGGVVERHQAGFLEFGFADQQPLGCDIRKPQS
jgi:hypothetical protein